MANGKALDQKGVVAELLKQSGDAFLGVVAGVFTDVLKPGAAVPEYWKDTQLTISNRETDQ